MLANVGFKDQKKLKLDIIIMECTTSVVFLGEFKKVMINFEAYLM